MRVWRWALLAAVIGLVVTACSGVPSSSSPKIVHRVAVQQQDQGLGRMPRPGADPREIVSDFLSANTSNDERHSSAGLYLTSDARRKWAPNTATVLDEVQVSPADPKTHTVTVTGRKRGTVDSRGIYQPILSGNGAGTPFNFSMVRVNGQWRIAQLQNVLIVDQADFETYFHAVSLYFFNLNETVLVPDLRYTPLDGQSLATWMLNALIDGPRPDLQSSVTTELPEQTEQRRASVTVGDRVTVEMPGSSELDDASRSRLAAQLATTLEQTTLGPPFAITDAGKGVTIPGIGTEFTSADFAAFAGGLQVSPTLFYVDTARGNRIADESGQLLPGKVNSQGYDLNSIALTNRGSDADLWVAATAGADRARQQLLMGTVKSGLRRAAGLRAGTLTRPTWAPDKPEAWVAEGRTVYRVAADDLSVQHVPLETAGGQQLGNVLALRFSPEGGRIAVVMQTAAGAQLWVGAVVRPPGANGSSSVRVDSLEPISPPGINLGDIAWNTPTTLYAVGTDSSSGDFGVWQVQVDGALWQQRSRANLPSAPDTITVTSGRLPWVSAGPALWVQRSNLWEPPNGAQTVYGRSPVYLE